MSTSVPDLPDESNLPDLPGQPNPSDQRDQPGSPGEPTRPEPTTSAAPLADETSGAVEVSAAAGEVTTAPGSGEAAPLPAGDLPEESPVYAAAVSDYAAAGIDIVPSTPAASGSSGAAAAARAAAIAAAGLAAGLVAGALLRRLLQRRSGSGSAATDARWRTVTVLKTPDQVMPGGRAPEPLAALGSLVEVRVAPAPGDKGTELSARLRGGEPSGAGAVLARARGTDPRQQVRAALRETKQLLEVGEILRVDPVPHGRRGGPAGKVIEFATQRAGGEGVL